MTVAKIINGYTVDKGKDGQWHITAANGEDVSGPLPSEAMAVEVASVLDYTPRAEATRQESGLISCSTRRALPLSRAFLWPGTNKWPFAITFCCLRCHRLSPIILTTTTT